MYICIEASSMVRDAMMWWRKLYKQWYYCYIARTKLSAVTMLPARNARFGVKCCSEIRFNPFHKLVFDEQYETKDNLVHRILIQIAIGQVLQLFQSDSHVFAVPSFLSKRCACQHALRVMVFPFNGALRSHLLRWLHGFFARASPWVFMSQCSQ